MEEKKKCQAIKWLRIDKMLPLVPKDVLVSDSPPLKVLVSNFGGFVKSLFSNESH